MQDKKKTFAAAAKKRVGRSAFSREGLGFDSPEIPELMLERYLSPKPNGVISGFSKAQCRLMEKILDVRKLDRNSVKEFSSLDSGVRELRFRNFLASVWIDGRSDEIGWRKKVESSRDGFSYAVRAGFIDGEMKQWKSAYESLCASLSLKAPNKNQRLAACTTELTVPQKNIIRQAPGLTEETAESLGKFRKWAMTLDQFERENLWRSKKPNILSLASVAAKIRFEKVIKLTDDENLLIRWILKTNPIEYKQLDDLSGILATGFKGNEALLKELRSLFWSGGPDDLLKIASRYEEYKVLMEFIGVPLQDVSAELKTERSFTKGSANIKGDHPQNDDSATSIDLHISGRVVRLDAVFDGVSGHMGGFIASGLARETLEIAAIAGWINSPEDVRRALLMADFIINLEKESYKFQADRKKPKDMGTTAAVSYIDGKHFYGIHCGDSQWKIFRHGVVLVSARPHGMGNRIWAGLGLGPLMMEINNEAKNYGPIILRKGDRIYTLTDGITDVLCQEDHEYNLATEDTDTPEAQIRKLVALADSRFDLDKGYHLLCNCDPFTGKDDDKAICVAVIE